MSEDPKLKFSVFALGSSSYPHFCGFGKWLDEALTQFGGTKIAPIGLGDELGDREGTFKNWLKIVSNQIANETGISQISRVKSLKKRQIKKDVGPVTRWRNLGENDDFDYITDLKEQHGNPDILEAKLTERKIIANSSGFGTILVRSISFLFLNFC